MEPGLHDAAYLRARHMAVPREMAASVSAPHLKHDDAYLTRRSRGQLSGVESIINSMVHYDTARRIRSQSHAEYGNSGRSDIAAQLGVQPYTILPAPMSGYSSPTSFLPLGYGSSTAQPLYGNSPQYQQPRDSLRYLSY